MGTALVAAPMALAQDDPTVAPEALAGFALDVCVVTADAPDMGETIGDFTQVTQDEGSARYEHPQGLTLAFAMRQDFFSCELVVPEASEAFFSALYASFGTEIQSRFEADDFEQVEDGQVWEIYTEDGLLVETELQQDEGGRITLTSSTETAQTPPRARDTN
ncbi:hypothetical protein [Citreimonas salinaria]|uniref:Uncharacterized protein n=1 Tax=Citreimonas salinaria TaxID=321339 RepID=A0A1H3JIA2_9RHOB|nr:hypothetical protein [Citreimonas salinaria]SDY39607.1 hypothetical protein SAMN05444340_10753 [Citreimonas salinaria]